MANGTFGGGDGSALDPYVIEDAPDLNALRNDQWAHYKLGADIDLADWGEWLPFPEGPPFFGSLDGAGHVISNLLIDSPASYKQALFQDIYSGAEIKNVTVMGTVKGAQPVALLAAQLREGAIVENCRAIGAVEGQTDVGLLVGHSGGEVTNCYSDGEVNGVGLCNNIGGLVGRASEGMEDVTKVNNCYSVADVNSKNESASWPETGGLIGTADGDDVLIENCYSAGKVTASPQGYHGGLIGKVLIGSGGPTITDCFYNTETSHCSDDDGRGNPITTVGMQDISTFSEWDFDDTWAFEEELNNGYPVLQKATHIPTPPEPHTFGMKILAKDPDGKAQPFLVDEEGRLLVSDEGHELLRSIDNKMFAQLYGASLAERPDADDVLPGTIFVLVEPENDFPSWMSDGDTWKSMDGEVEEDGD